MEEQMLEEIRHLVQEIEHAAHKGPVNIHELVSPSVSNNISILIFGRRYDYKDVEQNTLDNAIIEVQQAFCNATYSKLSIISCTGRITYQLDHRSSNVIAVVGVDMHQAEHRTVWKAEEIAENHHRHHQEACPRSRVVVGRVQST